jgi:O-methyltransferase domain
VIDWRRAEIARDGTHHVHEGAPLYARRFREVLKYHAPGLAPARDDGGAYHIDVAGRPAYAARYARTFGFYEGLAAVVDREGWCHVRPDGAPAYAGRFAWCGNYQEGLCAARAGDGRYLHLDLAGEPAYPDRHRHAGDFRDAVAEIQREDGLHTHIDRRGRPIHGRWFLDLDVFHKRLARARDERGWMHVDGEGHPTYERRFAAVEPFYNGQARVERFDGGLEIIDESGCPVVELRPARRTEIESLSADMVGAWRTRTIAAAVELGVLDAIPGSTAEIAARTRLDPDRCQRLLRALGELDLTTLDGGAWRVTARGALLRRDHPRAMAAAARFWALEHEDAWRKLPDALRAGGGWTAPSAFEAIAADRARLAEYHEALAAYARHDYAVVADTIDLGRHRVVIDAGGGTGALLRLLLHRHHHLRGVLLDRPEVARIAAPEGDHADRFEARGGDLFAPWGARADAVILARVLHDWDDDAAIRILAHARDAIEPGGRLYVIEMILDPDPRRFAGSLLDLHMLLATGGRERTEEGFRRLLRAAGLALIAVDPLPSVSSVITAELA